MEPTESTAPGASTPALIRRLNRHLTDEQRQDMIRWSYELLDIRDSEEPPLEKARRALDATYRARVVMAILSSSGGAFKQVAWDDRSWAARLGLGGAALAVAKFGSQGAGIAALGTAIAVPLWIVLGAGGSFAGMLIDELQSALERQPRDRTLAEGEEEIIDGEFELLTDTAAAGALPPASSDALEGADEPTPLWTVFRRAYREARERKEAAAPETPGAEAP